ncbi:MAG: VOC family protein [Minicystis sp.]
MTRFCRYQLRTTDIPAARAFYTAILGNAGFDIVPLPAQAAALGAPAHWLGHLGVDDVEASTRAFVERGATQLGPTRRAADGGQVAILRDPGGAVVALATPPSAPVRADILWHQLHAADLPRAMSSYCDLFGWQLTTRADLGPLGVYQHFSWQAGGENVGSMAATSVLPGIHPHWLFHFHVAALDPALATARAAGALVVRVTELPNGDRVAVCDDPQGAAFALRERASVIHTSAAG